MLGCGALRSTFRLVFFFKQKTAYEMRISDWSSDVCSSDLALAPDHEKGWQGSSLADGGLSFTRTLRGVTEQRVIDGPLIRSSEARRLDEMASELKEAYARHGELRSKDKTYRITGPIGLVTAVFELGRKGVRDRKSTRL